MIIKLLDYDANAVEVEVGELEDIKSIDMVVVTGDEILGVEYKDGRYETYDSCTSRWEAFFDKQYDIYNPEEGINLLEDERFINSTSSYWNLWVLSE